MTFSKYASVVIDLAIDKALDYGIPLELIDQIHPGTRVSIPVRGYLRKGCVITVKDSPNFSPVLPIKEALSKHPLLTDNLLQIALWMAKYYATPLNKVLKVILPAPIRKETGHKEQKFVMRKKTKEEIRALCKELRARSPRQVAALEAMLKVTKGILLSELLEKAETNHSAISALVKKEILEVDIVRIDRSPLIAEEYFKTKPKKLGSEQQEAFKSIHDSIQKNVFATHLLYGITGSGKTEIYLQAIEKALSLGKGAIVLVPEISLTAQMIDRFRSRFEGKLAVIHSRLSLGERYDEWHKLREGRAQICLGARSAVFSPVKNLGLIVVDEEHESSYKQTDEMPCYNARDVAVMLCHFNHSTAILGSATPSLESFANAKSGKYILNTLPKRASEAKIPKIRTVDMKREYERANGFKLFSDDLLTAIEKRFKEGEQSILFLNKRGYHSTLFCPPCGKGVECRHCTLPMTFHKKENLLLCHLCGYQIAPPPTNCPTCKKPTIKYKGVGTQLVEKSLLAIFPEIRTLRMDADTTRHKGSHQKLLRAFGTGKADVMIGTQMIAKGLHFPQVTLVGVLNCDSSLNFPDYRSQEKTFQLITQVAGRSGRGIAEGEVIIQTCIPDHPTIQLASKQDYDAFFKDEIEYRKLMELPPFTKLAKFTFSGLSEQEVRHFASQFRHELAKHLPPALKLNPIVPAGYPKIKDRYRYHFIIKGENLSGLSQSLLKIKETLKQPSSIKILSNIDPLSIYF